MNRRLNDQAMILDAIAAVRGELYEGMNLIEQAEVMGRLMALYSLLDVKRLSTMAIIMDRRVDSAKSAA